MFREIIEEEVPYQNNPVPNNNQNNQQSINIQNNSQNLQNNSPQNRMRTSQLQMYMNSANQMRVSQNNSIFLRPNTNNSQGNVKNRFLSFFPISSNYFGKIEDRPKDELGKTLKFKSFSEEEKLCKICYLENSNTIVNACGHGGVCKNCAQDVQKKMGKCVMCRGVIDKIFVIKIIDDCKIELVEELKII